MTPQRKRAVEREAAESLYERAWGMEEPQYRPKKDRWVSNLLEGLVTPLGPKGQLNLQIELNAERKRAIVAEGLLRRAMGSMEMEGLDSEDADSLYGEIRSLLSAEGE